MRYFLSLINDYLCRAMRPEHRIRAERVNYRQLRDRLLTDFPNLDDEVLADTLEGITDLREVLAQLVRSALEDEALSAGLSTRLADMKARALRLVHRAEKKRALVLQAMAEAEIKTVIEPDFTASLRQGAPTLDVVAEERIPDSFWKPQPPKLDRQSLLVALKGGVEIDGVVLAPPQVQLSVRTK
jgi:hypothetical protein